jgi:hypothetical protein
LQSIAPSQGSSIQFGTGSVGLPSISFIGDTNTGIYSPAADTLAFVEGGVEAMRINSSANVGIGTSSPAGKLNLNDGLFVNEAFEVFELSKFDSNGNAWSARSSQPSIIFNGEATHRPEIDWFRGTRTFPEFVIRQHPTVDTGGQIFAGTGTSAPGLALNIQRDLLTFSTTGTERARIDSDGNLLVGVTSLPSGSIGGSGFVAGTNSRRTLYLASTTTSNIALAVFFNPNGEVGRISTSASATTYATSSDYRLKHDIQPMTCALAKVQQLKPVTYKWNADDSQSQGFIAHELQEVVPDCVTGEKDAVDANGNPVYQGIDTSFLVATLTAAIQEQQQMIETLQAKVAALEAQ